MPRYYFNVDGSGLPADDVGTLLRGPKQAEDQAITFAGEMLKDIDGKFWNGPEWLLHVTDEYGAMVCKLRISGVNATGGQGRDT